MPPHSHYKHVNLALQGGGSHGAFTWGVLDALLEDGRLRFEGISGTSAGGMNAVVMLSGMAKGGLEGARQALHDFWREVSRLAVFSPAAGPFDEAIFGFDVDMSPTYMWFDVASRVFSPYTVNPLNINPLRDIVESQVDFELLRRSNHCRLFLSATNVHTGKVKVFGRDKINIDVVMASACLPFLYQAVEIDGVPYWDGGYMGNPALFPLHKRTDTEDIILVQINPIERRDTPDSAREIQNRMNEITFNSSLIAELRSIEFVQRLIDQGVLPRGGKDGYKRVRMHRIPADEALKDFSAATKLNADWDFLTLLFEGGRRVAKAWLEENFQHIGVRETLNLQEQISAENEGWCDDLV